MLLDMSNRNISKKGNSKKTNLTKKIVDSKPESHVKPKKHLKVDYFRNLDLVKKTDLTKDKEYLSNEWPLNDIKRINYPKFFCSLDSNLNNAKLELTYDNDLDTKNYLNSFVISSPVGRKILNSNSKKFKRKTIRKNAEKEFEKFCSSDINLIDLTKSNLDDMIRPFELNIDRLNQSL